MSLELDDNERLAQQQRELKLVMDAMRRAEYDARLLHIRSGQPLVKWENGRVLLIPPEEIVLPELPAD